MNQQMSSAYPFKICDPIHGFIRFNQIEGEVIDSRAFQRLRYIRQMGVAYLIYPGATHTRFEHSLGVMELASRIFESSTQKIHLSDEERLYWKQIVRLAALCHDMGHLPFSHTAERELLPLGGHEKMTVAIVQSEELRAIWQKVGPCAEEDILKLSVSEQELKDLNLPLTFSDWERVLSQIITEDNFGADRIDYLIRDARYTGVGYGYFDYHQLIDTLQIVEAPTPKLGIHQSGIQSVESLWIARYMMYARVYHHPKTRVYTQHMSLFMDAFYQEKGFPPTVQGYLEQHDFMILAELQKKADQGEYHAQALIKQTKPFSVISASSLSQKQVDTLKQRFGDALFFMRTSQKKGDRDFLVLLEGGECVHSFDESDFLREIPTGRLLEELFVRPDILEEVQQALLESRS